MRVPLWSHDQIKSLVAKWIAVWYSYKICWMDAFFYGHPKTVVCSTAGIEPARHDWKSRKKEINCCDPSKEMLPAGLEPTRWNPPWELKSHSLTNSDIAAVLICGVVGVYYGALPTELTEVTPRTGLEPVTPGLKGKRIIAVTTP